MTLGTNMDSKPSLPVPVDTQAAALAVGVSPVTIRVWAHRGLLTPIGREKRRRLYDLNAVIECADRTSNVSVT
jgi:predicted site-specific integrase-resolvase